MLGRKRLDNPDAIRSMIHDAGFTGDWNVVATAQGSTQRAFVARQGNEALFVKLGPVHPALDRLTELEVTPPILARGKQGGLGCTIFQYINETSLDRAWIREHADVIVDLFNVAQQDRMLTGLLEPSSPVTALDEHLATVVARLIERTREASAPVLRSSRVGAGLKRLRAARPRVDEMPLVPAHTDPNPSNILVTPDRTYLVDWDSIVLSDPMRDIGLLLWWFLPPEEWSLTLRRFWLPDAASATAIDRVYWWSAISSLRVALWIDRHARDEGAITSFLEDFFAAEARLPNPKLAGSQTTTVDIGFPCSR